MQPALESRVTRKLMWRIIPFVMLLYFVSFLDRVNVGFAAMTMNKAIGLSPTAFGLGAGFSSSATFCSKCRRISSCIAWAPESGLPA